MTLRFDFNHKPLRFERPVRIIQTSDIAHVIDKLAEIERATEQGFYAAGYLSYEAASAFQPYYQTPPQGDMPLLWFGIYDAVSQMNATDEATPPPVSLEQWQPQTSVSQYQKAIERIKSEIAAGNTYQANYTIRLEADSHHGSAQSSYDFYRYLLSVQQANYAAYLDTGRFKILSASPELFFHWHQGILTAKPMKGTAERGTDSANDLMRKARLLASEKNQAENVMIVDLLRNDLSQVAKPGSVRVTELFNAEQYPTIWQLTSTITAETRAQTTVTDIFRALFPCGSITGAPKASTMKLIAELEPQAREVYCGAIGYITPGKEALFNVPIRSVIIDSQKKRARYGVGGGITWDSTAEDEYQEVLDKAAILRRVNLPTRLLESLLLQDGAYHLADLHLNRLSASARYFNFAFDRNQTVNQLKLFAQKKPEQSWKVRLLLSKNGETTLESEAITPLTQPLAASWANEPVNSDNRLLYHKTTLRDLYPKVTIDHERLMYNQRNEITEFVNGNAVLLIDGQWLTPALTCGLLAGTERQALLTAGKIAEAVLSREALNRAEKIGFINSVRGWREVVWVGEK
ncbi:aminodeoxychorismate synthase component I [Budvicia diplopodorum]|uniref:aminodeoxychorismate synthase component I n=1 Tax=Budvicia diplopodorum TaxID=1119056 RepID=UPI00135B5421|nr:aminodeoxychorismate synthase component I [Budvicia diplopodorum]